jgi:hypothetical protein
MHRANGILTTVLAPTKQRVTGQATGVVVQIQPPLDLKASYNTPETDLLRARANARSSSAEYERLRVLKQDGKDASDKALESARAAEGDAALVQNAQQAITVLKGSTLLHWGPVVASRLENNSPELEHLLMQRVFLLQVTSTTAGPFAAPKEAAVQYPDGTHATAQFVSAARSAPPGA